MLKRLILSLALGLSMVSTPLSHDWYPQQCCGGKDCAEVEEFIPIIKSVPADALMPNDRAPYLSSKIEGFMVRTKYGIAEVPQNFGYNRSQDGSWHACLRPFPLYQKPASHIDLKQLICIFKPDSM